MSSRFTTFSSSGLAILTLAAVGALGCSEVRGRKRIQEANELYKEGRYQEAVAKFEEAERYVPDFPTLQLNKGYTCRQLVIPGSKSPQSEAAARCALEAFQKIGKRVAESVERIAARWKLLDVTRHDSVEIVLAEVVGQRRIVDGQRLGEARQVHAVVDADALGGR